MQKLDKTHLTQKYLKFPFPPCLNLESHPPQWSIRSCGTWHWRGTLPTTIHSAPLSQSAPEAGWREVGSAAGRQAGGWAGAVVAADSISPWPKGAAQTESSLLPPLVPFSKNGFHFAIVEVIPELWPASFPSPRLPHLHCQNRDLQSEETFQTVDAGSSLLSGYKGP